MSFHIYKRSSIKQKIIEDHMYYQLGGKYAINDRVNRFL